MTEEKTSSPGTSSPGTSSKEKTRRVHTTLSEGTYKLLKKKFPSCSDGQAAAQAIASYLGVERSADAFQGYKHFTCIHRANGYAVPGLNRAQAARLISVVSESMLAGLSKAEKTKLKRGIDRTTLQKKMKAVAGTGREFEFNGWVVLDDREGGQ